MAAHEDFTTRSQIDGPRIPLVGEGADHLVSPFIRCDLKYLTPSLACLG